MKKILFAFCFVCWCLGAMAQATAMLNGVLYTLGEDGNASATALKPKDSKLVDVEIASRININNRSVSVTRIANNGFKGCSNLKTVLIPNSVTWIGSNAFTNCKNLRSVIMPDQAHVEIVPQNFGSGGNGIFKGCKNLQSIRGNYVNLPDYIMTDALKECYDIPFIYALNSGETSDSEPLRIDQLNSLPSFSQFADTRVREPMELWEKRKPYESSGEYVARVTDASRDAKLKELLSEAREEYLNAYAPAGLSGRLGYYDADYSVFTVSTASFGDVYLKVPRDEAEQFHDRWNSVKIDPRFGILNDKVALLSCDFILDGKKYTSESVYTDEADKGYNQILRPLSELLAENTSGAEDKSQAKTTAAAAPKAAIDQVDLKIPATGIKDKQTFALIVGNENYQGNIKNVPYALNDAEIFSKYCVRTLGLPQTNVKLLKDATMGQLASAIEEICNKAKSMNGNARIIFYYSGHGKPDDNDRQAYIVPVDASPYSNRTNYSLSELYKELGNSNAKLVTVFLDACFSGATRNDDMLVAARAMRQVPREEVPGGNMIVFSAASESETAFPIEEKSHGVFTYALLDKLQTSQGKVSLGELADHISQSVVDISLSKNRPQNPRIFVSPALSGWEKIQLRK